MGQRLAVCFRYNDETIAVLYQHWSAYTVCSYEVVNDLVGTRKWPVPKSREEAIIIALSMISAIPGAKLDHDCEMDVIEEEFKDFPRVIGAAKFFSSDEGKKDRSDGLITIGSRSDAAAGYGEYGVFIELEHQRVEFQVMSIYETWEEMVEDYICGEEMLIAPKTLLGSKEWWSKENFSVINYPFEKSEKVLRIAETFFTSSYQWIDSNGLCYGVIA